MSTTRFASPKAPATDRRDRSAALVLCAHGARGGLVEAPLHAAQIARLGRFSEVRVASLTSEPTLGSVVAGLRADEAYIVPLLMAEGYTATEVLPRALTALPPGGPRVTLCRPIGSHPRMANLLERAATASCLARGWLPGETALVVLGHGTGRNPDSSGTALEHAARLARGGHFARIETAFLEQTPGLREVLESCGSCPGAVVVGLLADRGLHADQDVPGILAAFGGKVAYAGPVGARPEITELILDRAATAGARAA